MTSLNLEPYKYQLEDMKFLLKVKKGGLLHEPGVGKTFGALLAALYLIETEGIQVVVVLPPILINTWYDKIYEYFNTDIKTLKYMGPPKLRKGFDLSKPNIVLVSYVLLQKDFELFKEQNFKMVIVDETKYIKNGIVSRAKKTGNMNKFGCIQSLANRATHLVLMNGTPVTKSPEDVFHIIQLANPNVYVTKKNFLRLHAKYMPNDLGYPQIVGWKKLGILEELLTAYSRRLIKSEVLELPPKQLIIKQFDLEPKHQSNLKELIEFGFLELKDVAEDNVFLEGMSLLMTARQAMIDPGLVHVKAKSMYFEVLEDLLEDLKGKQVILFAHFKNTMTMLADTLKAKGISHAELHGRVSSVNKNKAVEDFKSGKVRVLLANAKSAGVGLDFQNCHNVIFFELDYEVDSFWQGMDRVHRPGQTKDVSIFVFIARNTPAVGLFRSIKHNVDFVKEILVGKEDASVLWDNKITAKEEKEWQQL